MLEYIKIMIPLKIGIIINHTFFNLLDLGSIEIALMR